ncbi:MAG: Maf family protein [Planctomycetota bacterium]|nr:Maf family protein [Planctomycetota bacterium]MDA1179791.1 Maf family protein [Planctomycetota bacterium]
MRLILASRSPQRYELMREAGYDFEVIPADESAECGICSRETAPLLVARLAKQKAENVAPHIEQGLVIGCDTVAECRGQILGKPYHRDHAREMLKTLQGQIHSVYSGLCIWGRPDDRFSVRVDVTRMSMKQLTESELTEYLDSGLWEGKAGAFGWQDRTGWLEILHGSASNVVGLPMELLSAMLKDRSNVPR